MFYALRTDQLEARPIPGTTDAYQPLFSPDGQSIAFEDADKLRKVRLDGSAPITIADAGAANGADWTTQDEIVIGSAGKRRGLSRVSASGGDLTEFAKPDASKGETDYLWPIAIPDGKAVVFTIWTGSLASARLATATLDRGDVIPLELKGIRPLAVIDRTLVYLQADGSVMAVKLDRSRRHLAGRPAPVLDPVVSGCGTKRQLGNLCLAGRGSRHLSRRHQESAVVDFARRLDNPDHTRGTRVQPSQARARWPANRDRGRRSGEDRHLDLRYGHWDILPALVR